MNSNNLSPDAKTIIKNNFGYRCNEASTGYHAPKDILDYEVNVLYNDDIIDTMQKLYNFKMKNIDALDQYLKEHFKGDYQLFWLISDPLNAIEFYSTKHKHFNDIKDAKHSDGTIIPVSQYLLPNDYLIISDCGVDGQLIACSDRDNIIFHQIN